MSETKTEVVQPEIRPPQPCKLVVLNDGNEGLVFKDANGELSITNAYDQLWEDYDFGKFEHMRGFLVWEGEIVFRPDNWDALTEEQREDFCDDQLGYNRSYEECFIGTWRLATADDLYEVGAIQVSGASQKGDREK